MKKERFVDDGRKIADMNVEGMPWSMRLSTKKEQKATELEQLNMTRGERRALVMGAISAVLPLLLAFAGLFFLAFLLLDLLWLN